MARSKSEDLDYADVDRAAERHDQLTSRRAFRVPEGMSVMKTEGEDDYLFDLLPYKTTNNPMLDEDSQGKRYHELTYWVHPTIGPDRKPVCCLRKNWDSPCPACELQEKLRAKLDRNDKKGWEATSQFNTQERQLFVPLNRMGQRPKIMLYDSSYAAFGERLKVKLNAGTEKNGFKKFLRLDGGKTIRATFTKQPLGEGRGTWLKCTNIEMEDREEPIPTDILDMVPDLESLLIKLEYAQIEELLYGKDGERDPGGAAGAAAGSNGKAQVADKFELPMGGKKPKDEEPAAESKPAKGGKAAKEEKTQKAIAKGDYVWHKEYGRCEVVRVSSDGSSLSLIEDNDGGESHSGVDPSDVLIGEEAKEAHEEAAAKAAETAKPKKGSNWGDDKPAAGGKRK